MKCEKCGTEYEGNFCPNGCNSPQFQETLKTTQPFQKVYNKFHDLYYSGITKLKNITSTIYKDEKSNIDTKNHCSQDQVSLKQIPFYKKWWFWLIVGWLALAWLTFPITAILGIGLFSSTPEISEPEPTLMVETITAFSPNEYELEEGENTNVTTTITPAFLSKEDITVQCDNEEVLSIKDVILTDQEVTTKLTLSCFAITPGEATVRVSSANDSTIYQEIKFTVLATPLINSISRISPETFSEEVGTGKIFTCTLTPSDVTKEDLKNISSNSEIVEVAEITVEEQSQSAILSFKLTAKSAGNATIHIISADNKTKSDTISCEIKEKTIVQEEIVSSPSSNVSDDNESSNTNSSNDESDANEYSYTGTTVYITPTGKKYHYSASCAGKNAKETTLDSAKQSHDPCQKCAQ